MIAAFVEWVHLRREIVRVGIAAAIGTLLAWVTYELVFFLNPLEPRATTSWAVAFLIGVFRQHHIHRVLSFPNSVFSYSGSLSREAVASIIILIAGAGLNFLLTQRFGIHHRMAWGSCLISVAALEYGLMKFFIFRNPPARPRR